MTFVAHTPVTKKLALDALRFMSLGETARLSGCSRQTLRLWANHAGIKIIPDAPKVPDPEVLKAREAKTAERKAREAARKARLREYEAADAAREQARAERWADSKRRKDAMEVEVFEVDADDKKQEDTEEK